MRPSGRFLRLFSLALLCSCAGRPETVPVDYAEMKIEALTSGAGENPVRTSEDLLSFASRYPELLPRLRSIAEAVGGTMREMADSAFRARDYPRAILYRRSLERLAEFPLFLESDNAKELSWSERDAISLMAQVAMEAGHELRAELLMKRLEPAQVKAATRDTAPESPAYPDLLDATVTIFVDRGIKIERGLGIPDRVIGSGFFIDDEGYVLTNYHVVSSEVDPEYEGYSELRVKLSGPKDERYLAKVVGWDRILDIALLKVPVKPKAFIPVTGRSELSPGDKVFAIGSPAGLESTVSAGIVSAARRDVMQMGFAMQIDVPVNPGNSGGPLIDSEGNLAGIVFAGLPQFQGLNFAIPESLVAETLPSLYSGGERARAYSGVLAADKGESVIVLHAFPLSPAARIGLKSGDAIESVNGTNVRTIRDIQTVLQDVIPGELVLLGLGRDNVSHTVAFESAERPWLPLEKAVKNGIPGELLAPLLGMRLSRTYLSPFEVSYTIEEVYPETQADQAGLSRNDSLIVKESRYLKDEKAVLYSLFVKRRKQGYLESIIRIPSYLETNTIF